MLVYQRGTFSDGRIPSEEKIQANTQAPSRLSLYVHRNPSVPQNHNFSAIHGPPGKGKSFLFGILKEPYGSEIQINHQEFPLQFAGDYCTILRQAHMGVSINGDTGYRKINGL